MLRAPSPIIPTDVNKVIYGGRTLIDLSQDTVNTTNLLLGVQAHDKSGASITGTCTFDVDSTDATVAVAEMLAGKTAYARGAKLTGTMPNNGNVSGSMDGLTVTSITIPAGYTTGGTVSLTNDIEAALAAI